MTARPRTDWLSPSLVAVPDGAIPAYELKFLVSESAARGLTAWAAARLAPDPHAGPAGTYRITSVYLDTPSFDVARRADGFKVHKHRVRRYGADSVVHLERKSKQGGRVWKHRTAVPLDRLDAPAAHWFAGEVADLGLKPACRLTYDRTAFVGAGPTGPVRLTLDRPPVGARADALVPEPVADGLTVLGGLVVVEFKYLAALPPVFKEAVEAFKLTPTTVSKYRRYAAAAGLTGAGPAHA